MRTVKFLAVSLLVALTTCIGAFAQNRTVSGKVLDNQQQPLIGAAVLISGTSTGTTTDVNGSFSMSVPSGDVVLEVSSLGYITRKVSVPAAKSSVNVTLDEDNMTLNETVVVGYGTQKKVNLTGAISVVDDKALKDRSSHNLVTMLQGSVPGLNITTQSGNPGSTGKLNIRGFTSINEANPIVLIDGALGDLEDVNPNDVESISVIKDAAAAAVYGARAAYGVILVTTKKGSSDDGKAKIRYSGRFGWEEPTTSTDYEDRGYWSVYTLDTFWKTQAAGTPYTGYTEHDMMELLARVNDKTENPDRPWVVKEVRNGKEQWIYYCNTDWYHEMFRDRHPVQQHNISVSGGTKNVRYFISGGYDRQTGIMKAAEPDVFQKYNLRAKIDAKLNKIMSLSNNTSFYNSNYSWIGVGDIQDVFRNLRHTPASFPLFNPDGTGLYNNPLIIGGNYNVANGRQIVFAMGKHKNFDKKFNFTNTTELVIKPVDHFNVTANFTYRRVNRNEMHRTVNIPFGVRPGVTDAYTTGAGLNQLEERTRRYDYYTGNIFGTYENSFKDAHNLKVMLGFNVETYQYKNVTAKGQNLSDENLNDFNLVSPDESGAIITTLAGGQSEYALAGFFGRLNYDYKGRYLIEASGRYDGSSRFAKGHRWGLFPSVSGGWRISEEDFFKPLRNVVDNLKLRASFGSLGNQNVSSYYTYMRLISISDFSAYSFNEGSAMAKYSTLGAPVASNLTWETAEQWDGGLDLAMLNNRLNLTADVYVRNTKNMLTDGVELPAVYGATVPQMNTADLRTKGYELSLTWRDRISVAGSPLEYSLGFNLSDYQSHITKYDNKDKTFAKKYYEGMRIGEIWGFVTDGLYQSTEEAQEYAKKVDLSYINKRITGGWQAGDLKFVDLDNDGILGIGSNTVDKPGDRKILGNSLPSLSYGINASVRWLGFDASVFFQGTGNHYWYPTGQAMGFWGPYSYPYLTYLQKDFLKDVWAEDNPDAYFTRPMAYSATSGPMSYVNDRYLQNIRYMRLKNLTVGYTVPVSLTKKIGIDQIRVYFSGENLCYWSPLKKHTKYVDPEAAFNRSSGVDNNAYYPWQKTCTFGVDITF